MGCLRRGLKQVLDLRRRELARPARRLDQKRGSGGRMWRCSARSKEERIRIVRVAWSAEEGVIDPVRGGDVGLEAYFGLRERDIVVVEPDRRGAQRGEIFGALRVAPIIGGDGDRPDR